MVNPPLPLHALTYENQHRCLINAMGTQHRARSSDSKLDDLADYQDWFLEQRRVLGAQIDAAQNTVDTYAKRPMPER